MAKRTGYSLDNRGRGYHSSTRNKKIDNQTANNNMVKGWRSSRAKELDLLNAQGPHSIPDRHYPQTVKALPWPPQERENEDE